MITYLGLRRQSASDNPSLADCASVTGLGGRVGKALGWQIENADAGAETTQKNLC